LGGIKDGKNDTWVREQFYNYTMKFLSSVQKDNVSSVHKKTAEIFKSTPYYENYLKKMEDVPENESVADILQELKKGEQLPILERVKKIFELSKMTGDLSIVDEVCNLNGVEIISQFLLDENSQYRKYSASVLAQLACSVKGQLAILAGNVLPSIIQLLGDEMPNVRIGACYCIMKISELFVGVKALLEIDIIEKLEFDSKEVIDIKQYSILTIYNIYRYAPNTKRPELKWIKQDLEKPIDAQYMNSILLLLDLWNEDLTIKVGAKTKKLLAKIDSTDATSRTEGIKECQNILLTNPPFIFELISGGIVEILIDKDLTSKSKFVSIYGVQILTQIADTNYGGRKILE
jgi:hypothetical protein